MPNATKNHDNNLLSSCIMFEAHNADNTMWVDDKFRDDYAKNDFIIVKSDSSILTNTHCSPPTVPNR